MSFRHAVALLLCLSGSAYGQVVVNVTAVEFTGKIAQLQRGLIAVTAEGGQTWQVKITNQTKMHVGGTVAREAVTAGMYVRFSAMMDKRLGRSQDKISAVTVFSPAGDGSQRVSGGQLLYRLLAGRVRFVGFLTEPKT